MDNSNENNTKNTPEPLNPTEPIGAEPVKPPEEVQKPSTEPPTQSEPPKPPAPKPVSPKSAKSHAEEDEAATHVIPMPSAWRTMWNEIYKDKIALVALFTFILVTIAIFVGAAAFSGSELAEVNLRLRNEPPGPGLPLGADPGGRGILQMLFLGARVSFIVGVSVTILGSIIGILVGLIAGFYGGTFDNIVMRIVDTWSMLPTLMIIIVIVSMMPYYTSIHFVLVMSAFGWTGTARIMRAMALQQRSLDYVSASKTLGTRNIVIMFREVLPSLVPVITVNLTLTLAANIGIETGLTFLGFGLPFGTPSLGRLIAYAIVPHTLQFRMNQWLPAATLVFLLMLCVYCVGQAMNRASDVRQRRA